MHTEEKLEISVLEFFEFCAKIFSKIHFGVKIQSGYDVFKRYFSSMWHHGNLAKYTLGIVYSE